MFPSSMLVTLATLEDNEKEMCDEVGMHRKTIYLFLTEMQGLFFATKCWVRVFSVKRKLLLLAQEELLEGD